MFTHLQNASQDSSMESNLSYELSLSQISDNLPVKSPSVTEVNDIHIPQTYNELAAQVWQELVATDDEEEIVGLLEKLEYDIDAFAWLHDQYELAIASANAKRKKVQQMLQEQVQELTQGQEILNQYLIELYQNQKLPKKSSGDERNINFREYSKVNVKVKPEELPLQYRREKINYTADKNAIREALKQGIDLDLKKMAEIDRNLKIKFGFQ